MGAARSHCYQRPTPPDSEILSVHRLFIWSADGAPETARGTAILGLIGGLWAWAGIALRGRALAVGEVRRGRRLSAP